MGKRLHAGITPEELLQEQTKRLGHIRARIAEAGVPDDYLDRLLLVARGVSTVEDNRRRPRKTKPDRELVRLLRSMEIQHTKIHRVLLGEKQATCIGDGACVEKHRVPAPAVAAHARACQLVRFSTNSAVSEFTTVINGLVKMQGRSKRPELPVGGKGAVAAFLMKEAGLTKPDVAFLLVAHAAGWKLPVPEAEHGQETERVKSAKKSQRQK